VIFSASDQAAARKFMESDPAVVAKTNDRRIALILDARAAQSSVVPPGESERRDPTAVYSFRSAVIGFTRVA
jgi:hypothetical protein